MRDLVIVGCGGHGRETLDIVDAINAQTPTWRFVGFADDDPRHPDRLQRRQVGVIGPVSTVRDAGHPHVIGVGAPDVRARIDRGLTGAEAVTLVHPAATVASDNRLGPGMLVAAGARITTNVTVGRHVHLNVNAVVSHDCVLGDHVTVSPGVNVNGSVHIGDRVFLGTGAIVLPGLRIGDDAVVGAGAVVIRDVAAGSTVVGVPAR
ncbi:MAG: acetyltransferase [Actinomycetota bacterium]